MSTLASSDPPLRLVRRHCEVKPLPLPEVKGAPTVGSIIFSRLYGEWQILISSLQSNSPAHYNFNSRDVLISLNFVRVEEFVVHRITRINQFEISRYKLSVGNKAHLRIYNLKKKTFINSKAINCNICNNV